MKIKRGFAVPFVAVILAVAPGKASAQYTPVAFAYNTTFSDSLFNGSTYPTGALVLGGVPFAIPGGGDMNVWHSAYQAGDNPRSLIVPIGLADVDEVHTLIDNWWGTAVGPALAGIEFHYSDASMWSAELLGNEDIRDYNNWVYTNSINGTTTVEVFNNGSGQRLDKQFFDVPDAFVPKTLSSIVLWDEGADGLQRIFLGGLTVHQVQNHQEVPEPGTLAMIVGAGIAGLTLRRTRRRS